MNISSWAAKLRVVGVFRGTRVASTISRLANYSRYGIHYGTPRNRRRIAVISDWINNGGFAISAYARKIVSQKPHYTAAIYGRYAPPPSEWKVEKKEIAGVDMRATNREIDVTRSRGVGGEVSSAPRGYFSLDSVYSSRLSTENSVKHTHVSHRATRTTIFVKSPGWK